MSCRYSVFWIKDEGSATDIHSFDYFEFPAYLPPKVPDPPASAAGPPSYLTTASGADDMATDGVVVRDYVKIWSPSAKDVHWKDGR